MPKLSPVRIIVTCGPSSEPIDEVRHITNFSTGELGALLSDCLAAYGWEVFCLRGMGATYPPPLHARVLPFTTNADLEKLLSQLAASFNIATVFHAAALCDFRLCRIENAHGVEISPSKLNGRSGTVRFTLEPAPKIIRQLRGLFPHSQIVGWKYELEGLPADAVARGLQQITENEIDACVVNGRALGNGFAFLEKGGEGLSPVAFPNKTHLCAHLSRWLSTQLSTPAIT